MAPECGGEGGVGRREGDLGDATWLTLKMEREAMKQGM